MLSILRTLLMVRNAIIVFFLAVFTAHAAHAVRVSTAKTRTHASITKSTLRTLHRPSHPSKLSATRRPSHPSTHRVARRTYGAKHPSAFRRASFNRYHSRAHFQQIASASPRPAELEAVRPAARSNTVTTPPVDQAEDPTAEALRADAAARDSEDADADGKTIAADSVANPAAAPVTDPLDAAPPSISASGPVASLHRPRMFASPLAGTHDSLVRQNERSEDESLERIEDEADLNDRIARGMLVPRARVQRAHRQSGTS